MDFTAIAIFNKEFKKLFKKYKTLDSDFKIFKKLISDSDRIKLFSQQSTNHHSILHANKERTAFVFKSRLQCRALRSSRLRVVYFYDAIKNQITFLEIFFKGKKENENVPRWKKFIA